MRPRHCAGFVIITECTLLAVGSTDRRKTLSLIQKMECRKWPIGNRFDLRDIQYTQISESAMERVKRIVIGAEIF